MSKIVLEICAASPDSAVTAQAGGADRVELCSALELGGLTPSHAAIRRAVAELSIPVNALIRPRSGDFLYSNGEIELMCADIREALRLGASGIVCGALDRHGDIDVAAMHRLLDAAQGWPFTFHRAFDLCRNAFAALEQLEKLGIGTLLTSGQAATAIEGAAMIKKLQKATTKIVVMAGCGLRAPNLSELVAQTGIHAVHMSASRTVESRMEFHPQGVVMGDASTRDQYGHRATDREQVAAARRALDEMV